jgi:ubiquinone/menaquinone biosynthesis C-methylase UbiE
MRPGDHAYIPKEALGIMTARTLANSHPVLLGLLEPGLAALDVGCGPGTLTVEIARRVDPGAVVGMDTNPEMIQAAEEASPPGELPNLVFYRGDIRESTWDAEFDLVNGARMLQWIADAHLALERMARAVRPDGLVVLLDYDHTRAVWSRPPAAWSRFYEAFLAWRAAGGLDNAMATRLAAMCAAAGLADVREIPRTETVRAGDADFFRAAGLWRMVIDSRGRQMVASGYLTEPERIAALDAFTGWMQSQGATQTLHETCVVATRPPQPTLSPIGGADKREGERIAVRGT